MEKREPGSPVDLEDGERLFLPVQDIYGLVWRKKRYGRWSCADDDGTMTLRELDQAAGPLRYA